MSFVCIPGLSCSARLYQSQVPVLWPMGPVQIANHTSDTTMKGIAQSVLNDAPETFTLIGLSMGGYAAFEILKAALERVKGLVLMDTSARADTAEQSGRRQQQIKLAQDGKYNQIIEMQFPMLVHQGRHEDMSLKALVRQMALETGAENFVRQQQAIMSRQDMRGFLGEIKVPVLVMVGEGDTLTPPELAQEMAGNIKNAQLKIVPDSGHLCAIEQPETVNQMLVEFLQAS